MLKFPAIEELVIEVRQRNIAIVLEARFGEIPQTILSKIQAVTEEARLTDLLKNACTCPDPDSVMRSPQ